MRAGGVTFLLFLFILGGCEDRDITRPQAFIQVPIEGDTLYADSIPWSVLFTDEDGLSQYRLELNGQLDVNGAVKDSMERIIAVGEVGGTVAWVTELNPMPPFVFEGWYRLMAACVDGGGNQSFQDTVTVYLRNRADVGWPTAGLATVPWNDTVKEGRELTYTIDATDDVRLWNIRLDAVRAGTTDTVHTFTLDSTGIAGSIFNQWINAGYQADWVDGVYFLNLKVWDCCHLSQRTDSVYVK
jgi:hypothetical protein